MTVMWIISLPSVMPRRMPVEIGLWTQVSSKMHNQYYVAPGIWKSESLVSHTSHRAAPISVSLAFSQTPTYVARPQIWGLCIAWCSCHTLAFAGTHYAYLQRDGQAELTSEAGYILRWFACLCPKTAIHASTNQTQCRIHLLIETIVLPLNQTAV